MTPEGERAQAIADAAFEDKSRVAQASADLDALAATVTGQALIEVQDMAKMVNRLGGPGGHADLGGPVEGGVGPG